MHYQFGEIVDSGLPDEKMPDRTEGFVDIHSMILMRNHSTVVVDADGLAALVLQMNGRINKSEDTVSASFRMSWLDTGVLVAELIEAATKSSKESAEEMERGMEIIFNKIEENHE